MAVDFNGKVSGVSQLTNTGATNSINNEGTNLGLMGYGHGNTTGGLSVERHIPNLDNAIAHFAGVPDFEYNSNGENLVIVGDIMPDRLDEREFCEV